MRRENRRRQLEEGLDTKKMLYITGSVLALAIIVFVITFLVYTSKLNGMSQISKLDSNSIGTIRSEETSNPYGRTVNEMQNTQENEISNSDDEETNTNVEENNTVNQKSNKIAVNTSNVVKKTTQTNAENKTKTENEVKNESEDKNTESKEEEKVPDPEFQMPVTGEIMKEFADSKLLYSNTLDVWTTHNGIDIKADKTTVVKASAEGKVTSIKNDPRYGLTITIEHVNGYKTVYANLLSTEFIEEGEKVEQGQSIGTIGNSGAFEISEDPHLHFELIKDNEQQDPELYLN